MLLLFATVPAPATVVQGLYEAVVPVADKTEAVRTAAVREAMRQVLIKLTGDHNAGARAAPSLLNDTQRFVVQYRYRDIPPNAVGGATAAAPGLWVQFDRAALERAIADTGLPLWGRERPAALLWLVVEEGGSAGLVGSEDARGYPQSLQAHANRRGLPLLLPLLDLDDEGRITADDVKADNAARVAVASQRYGAEATVTATLSQPKPPLWTGRFTLYFNGQNSTWSSQGDTADKAIAQGIDNITDALAVRFIRTEGAAAGETVQVQVEGIRSAEQYADVQRYLGSLNTVTAVGVKRVEPDRVTFELATRGGMQAIGDSIALGRTLQPLGNPGDGHFRLVQ